MAASPPVISVVVCTHNRSTLLGEACRAILAVKPPADAWELLIVDNRSTDDTPEVAESVRQDHADRVRVVTEQEVGLSAARNAGIQAAAGQVIVFVDDDAFPVPGWLRSLVDALREDEVLCCGGPVAPDFEGELPDWFLGRYLPYLTVWDRGDEAHELLYNEYPRGTNIAFRREAFDRFGLFSPHLGRKARSLLSCEETEFCLRIERGGYRSMYVPGAGVRHRTNAGRITPDWLVRRFGAQGRSEAIVDWQHAGARGLARGLRSHTRRARAASRERSIAGGLFLRCQRRAARGYLRGALTAPLTVARYRPPDGSVALRRWLPPG